MILHALQGGSWIEAKLKEEKARSGPKMSIYKSLHAARLVIGPRPITPGALAARWEAFGSTFITHVIIKLLIIR
jgi:hypothetical protein